MKSKILLLLGAFTFILSLIIILQNKGSVKGEETIFFFDDFSDNVIGSDLVVKNYTLEDSGSFGSFTELNLAETGGEIKINGTGTIDVVTVDGQTVGWIGKSLMLIPKLSLDSPFAIETQVRIVDGVHGFSAHLTIEFDADNRITFNLGDASGIGRFTHLAFDEFNFIRCIGENPSSCPFTTLPFVNNQLLTLRLEFDPATRITKAFIDGVLVLSGTYNGALADANVGLAATVRAPGDVIDARFDNFKVAIVPALLPPTAVAGTSLDQDNQPELNGSLSTDPDGTIVSYSWQISGEVNPRTGQIVSIDNLSAGEYTVDLTITDNDGATDTDTMLLGIPHSGKGIIPPTPRAGPP